MTAAHDDYFTAPTTPTPGDLSARQVIADMQSVADLRTIRHSYIGEKLKGWIAALSALPAAGGERTPDGYHYVYVDPFGSGEEVIVHNSGGEWNGQKPRRNLPYYYTTPQPSAAEWAERASPHGPWIHGHRTRDDFPPPDAAVGAQGDGDAVERLVGVLDQLKNQAADAAIGARTMERQKIELGKSLGFESAILHIRAALYSTAPAAGKGVAEYVLALLVTGRYVTQAKVDEARRIALGCEPAQPADDDEAMVPGDADDMAEALAEISKTLGCDNTLDDILHAIHAIPQKEVAEGVVLALKEPTDAMNDAGGRSLNSDLGFPSYRADRAASAARNAYVTMLAALEAALTRQPVAGENDNG